MSFGTIIRTHTLDNDPVNYLNVDTACLSLDGNYIYARNSTSGKLNRVNFSDFQGRIGIGADTIPHKQMLAHPTDATKLVMVSNDGVQFVNISDGTLATPLNASDFTTQAGWGPDNTTQICKVDDDNFLFGSRNSTAHAICNYNFSGNTITRLFHAGFFFYTFTSAADGTGDVFVSFWSGTDGGAVFKFIAAVGQWRVVAGRGVPGDTVGVPYESKISEFTQMYYRPADGVLFLGTSTLPKYVQGEQISRFSANNFGFPVPNTTQLLRVADSTEFSLIDATFIE